MECVEAIQANGWKQGSVLLSESFPKMPDGINDDNESIFIVLTQDCDLVQDDFEKEPYVELLKATPASDGLNGNFAHGKNPRIIDIQIGEQVYRASCHDRALIDRKHLISVSASEIHQVSPQARDMITEWIAKRYTRPAFPGTFNDRLRPEAKAIGKMLKTSGHYFEDILINCSPETEKPKESYILMVWMVMRTEDHEDEIIRIEAQKTVTSFEQLIDACPGLEVKDCRVVSEATVTLDDLRFFVPWDFDYLTYRKAAS
jgi:hypothetical protein